MDAFLDVSESEFAERTAELINFYENNSKSICYEIGYIQYAKDVRRQIYANYSNVILLMKHKPGGMSCHFMPAGKYLTTYFKGHWRNIGRLTGNFLLMQMNIRLHWRKSSWKFTRWIS